MGGAAAAAAAAAAVDDASEQLDVLLRQSIVGFTRRWAGVKAFRARFVGCGERNGYLRFYSQLLMQQKFHLKNDQPRIVGRRDDT